MLNEEESRRAEFLFASITGFSKEKCAKVFAKYTLTEILENPMLFDGSSTEVGIIDQVREFVKTVNEESMFISKRQIRGPSDAIDYFENSMSDLDHEEVHLLMLNTRHRIIRCITVSKGGLTGAGLTTRELVREALKHNASAVMIAHNHPSGDPTPSSDDVSTTREIKKALSVVGIEFVDHIVVGKNNSVSLKEKGVMERRDMYKAETIGRGEKERNL